jgi:hypothetical protein
MKLTVPLGDEENEVESRGSAVDVKGSERQADTLRPYSGSLCITNRI